MQEDSIVNKNKRIIYIFRLLIGLTDVLIFGSHVYLCFLLPEFFEHNLATFIIILFCSFYTIIPAIYIILTILNLKS